MNHLLRTIHTFKLVIKVVQHCDENRKFEKITLKVFTRISAFNCNC